MSHSEALLRAIAEIRVSDAVVVLGAGASFEAGMPLANQLPPLVWHTLDAHPGIRQVVASLLGVPDIPAKGMVGDDSAALRIAFEEIGKDRSSRSTFQSVFSDLDRHRRADQSIAHDSLAKLIYVGLVARVVGLNWDTLLETSFERRYGIRINAQGRLLWKPHGDCDAPSDWVLPYQDGLIPHEIVEDLDSLVSQRPRVLLIVGYSERDESVVRRLVSPLAARWRVFRLGHNATGEGAICLSASEGISAIASALVPHNEVPGWEFVSFAGQRGIEAAVSGERLGPRDVDSCPRLPHYESALKAVEAVNFVDIAGRSGCGKSITAWQVARTLNRAGWQVLRRESREPNIDEIALASLRKERWKRVVVVDDTQTLRPTFVERLSELAGSRLTVITGTTDATGDQPRSVRIPAELAVETLATELRKQRVEVLSIVKRLDSKIGDEYMATPLEWRIDEAAKEKTPWEFAFVLRGGWSRAREQLSSLRDFDRADQLLALIAARQLLSLDAGTDVLTLVEDAIAMGRSEHWVLTGIDLLRRQNAILPTDPLRCLHIQSAVVVLENSLKRRTADGFVPLVDALRRMAYDSNAPVRGVSWLTERVHGSDAFRYSSRDEDKFFERIALEQLMKRLTASSDAVVRRDAAFLMSRLLWYDALTIERISADFDSLRGWFETATGENCYALGDLVNTLAYKKASKDLVKSIDPHALWHQVNTLDSSSAYGWGHLLGRLAYAGGRKWRTDAIAEMDRDRVLSLIDRFTVDDIDGLCEFVSGLASFDSVLGLDSVRRAMPMLQEALGRDALGAYRAISDLDLRVLGNRLFTRARPTPSQRALARQIANGIRPSAVALGIQTCRYGDWETYARLLDFVRRSSPKKHREIAAVIDWQAMERRTADFWSRPPRELRLLLSYIAVPRSYEPVRSWIFRHRAEIRDMDPILTGLSPKTAIAVLKAGGRVNLGGHNGSDWALQMWAVAHVARIDRQSAVDVVRSNRDHIVGRLSKLEGIDCEQLPQFLRLLRELDRPLFREMLREIDASSAADKWPRLIQDRRPEVRRGATRTFRIIAADGPRPIKELAESLLFQSQSRMTARPRAEK